jgi:hypothetical protein
LTFVGPDLVAARWKQFRAYFADVAPGRSGGGGATLLGGVGASAAPMNGYPKMFNIEADPHEDHNIGEMYEWTIGPVLKGGGGVQGKPRKASKPAGSEHDAVLSRNMFEVGSIAAYPVRATMSGLANCGRQRDNQSCCAKSFCVVDPSIICFANFRICIARPRADRRHCVRLRS